MMTGMRTFVKDREMMVIRTPALTDLSDGNIMIDRQPVSDTYTMGTADTKVMDPIAITIPYNEDAVDGRDLGIYLLRNGQWDYVGGEANSTDGTITARVGQLGTYRVMAGGHGEVAPELAVPDDFALGQNYPNPFNPSTTFQVALPHTGRVTLAVYDILGREVARVHDGLLTYGMHTFQWNGRSATGTPLSSGVYFLNMEAEGFNATRKMMLVK